jgi:hypothetical protein
VGRRHRYRRRYAGQRHCCSAAADVSRQPDLRLRSALRAPTDDDAGPSHGGGGNDSGGHGHGNDRKEVQRVFFGKFIMDTWYHAPFPAEYEGYHELWFCEFTLRFFRTEKGWLRHHARNKQRHPPGDEIYRKGNISMFEIDGSKQKLWCQHLCYIAKLFLDHKTLFYDVDVFFFCA